MGDDIGHNCGVGGGVEGRSGWGVGGGVCEVVDGVTERR